MRNKLLKVLIILLMFTCLCACKSETTVFEENGFKIELPSSFKKKNIETFTYYYQSDKAIITVINESFDNLTSVGLSDKSTVSEYLTKALEKNEKKAEIQIRKNSAYAEYETESSNYKYYHLCIVLKSDSGFWLINYTCEMKYKEELYNEFFKWTDGIEL